VSQLAAAAGHVGVDGENLAAGQHGPAFFVVPVEFACASISPGGGGSTESEDGFLRGAAICHHHLSVWQDDALRIADRRPTWGRSDAGPFVGCRVIDCAKRSPDATSIVIFAAHDYDLSVGKH